MTECAQCGTSIDQGNENQCGKCSEIFCNIHAHTDFHDCAGPCNECYNPAEYICDECELVFCSDHINLGAHRCLSLENNDEPEHATRIGTDTLNLTQTSDFEREAVEFSQERERTKQQPRQPSTTTSSSSGRMIAGGLVVVAGTFLSITGIGAIIGVPMVFVGFGLIFPRFTLAMISLAVVAFLLVALSL